MNPAERIHTSTLAVCYRMLTLLIVFFVHLVTMIGANKTISVRATGIVSLG